MSGAFLLPILKAVNLIWKKRKRRHMQLPSVECCDKMKNREYFRRAGNRKRGDGYVEACGGNGGQSDER